MKLYKDGQFIEADKTQLKIMLEAGWSTEPELKKVEKPAAVNSPEIKAVKIEAPIVVKEKKIVPPEPIKIETPPIPAPIVVKEEKPKLKPKPLIASKRVTSKIPISKKGKGIK